MNNKKIFALFICCYLLFSWSYAQGTFEVPKDYKMKTTEDFKKYSPAIIHASQWLEQTDLDKEQDKRKEVNKFVIKWASDNPAIKIDMNMMIVKLTGNNPQLLSIYIAAYSRSSIENNNSPDKNRDTKAALLAIINIYKKGIAVKDNKEMDKLVEVTSNNQLDAYVKEHFDK